MALVNDLLSFVTAGTARRWRAHRTMREAVRAYDAAKASQYRPVIANLTSGDGVMAAAGTRIRQLARHLDENHDLVVAVFDDIVNNTVGAGIKVAPMVRRANGTLDEKLNDQIVDLWDEWANHPETTGDLGWESVERLVCRSLMRDGEVFAQRVVNGLYRYTTAVPFVLELLEADMVPFDYDDPSSNTLHGVTCNEWNQPTGYYVYRNHPGDPLRGVTRDSLKVIGADRMLHLKFSRRLRQRRGVPVIHAVITRLQDLKDYEESERIAAKVAADLTWFVKRTSEYQGAVDLSAAGNRQLQMAAGAGFELLPGEDVGTIKSERPNASLVTFREAMLRAVAGGTGTRFSSIARNYNGTYSAQRQELVEGAIAYRAHFAYLVRRFYRPVYRTFIQTAIASGALDVRLRRGMSASDLYRADFRAPTLPWIDPGKEADAYRTLVDAGLESRQEVMRQRGRDPGKVWDEIEEERASGLFASDIEQSEPAVVQQQADDAETDVARERRRFGSAA